MGTRTTTLQTLALGVELELLTCAQKGCGISFALPSHYVDSRRADHASWYCPNGHSQWFPGKSKEEQLKEELERVKKTVDYFRGRTDRLEDDKAHLKRQHAAQKGVATRLRKKAIAGECAFCHERFANVADHVQAEHPTEAAEQEVESDG